MLIITININLSFLYNNITIRAPLVFPKKSTGFLSKVYILESGTSGLPKISALLIGQFSLPTHSPVWDLNSESSAQARWFEVEESTFDLVRETLQKENQSAFWFRFYMVSHSNQGYIEREANAAVVPWPRLCRVHGTVHLGQNAEHKPLCRA